VKSIRVLARSRDRSVERRDVTGDVSPTSISAASPLGEDPRRPARLILLACARLPRPGYARTRGRQPYDGYDGEWRASERVSERER